MVVSRVASALVTVIGFVGIISIFIGVGTALNQWAVPL